MLNDNLPPRTLELVPTADGSATLRLAELNECFHSKHGALVESRHIYIAHGLRAATPARALRVLEVGFGTGLNVLLTAEFAQQHPDIELALTTLEPFPLAWPLVERLGYGRFFSPELATGFAQLHQAPWGQPWAWLPNFTVTKLAQPLLAFAGTHQPYQVVYYDAFGPRAQPDLWEEAPFAHLRNWLAPGAILTTYCAKGEVRRRLQALGYTVERLPGPPGKRDMTRARWPGPV